MCAIFSIRRDVSGPVPGEGVFIVTANHLSYLDILVLGSLYPSQSHRNKDHDPSQGGTQTPTHYRGRGGMTHPVYAAIPSTRLDSANCLRGDRRVATATS